MRRLKRIVQKSRDKNHARRANAILLLREGLSNARICRYLHCCPKSLNKWRMLYEQLGEEGLAPNEPGRPVETVSDVLRARLLALVIREPKEFGYARARPPVSG